MLLTSWLIHTCTRTQRTGVTSKGDPSYGASSTFRARVEKKRSMVAGADGKDVACEYVLATTTAIAYDDRIWLPAIGGEGADDTADLGDANLPKSIEVATNKLGTQKLYIVRF